MQPLFAQVFSGMELLPLMLLALGGAGVCSIVAVIAVFFNRTTTRVCAGLAFGFIAAYAFLILMGNRWNFPWLVTLFSSPNPLNVIVFSARSG